MKLKDVYYNQLIAIVIPYRGLHIGLKGNILGTQNECSKLIVQFRNRSKTIEAIPLINVIGIVDESI